MPGANREAILRAIETSSGLPERDQLMMAGRLAFIDSDYDEAEHIFLQVIRDNPQDVYALLELENLLWFFNYHRGRSLHEAVPIIRRILELAPDFGYYVDWHISEAAIDAGDLEYLTSNPPCDGPYSVLCQLSKLVQAYDQSPSSALDVEYEPHWMVLKEFDWMRTDPDVSIQLASRALASTKSLGTQLNGRWQLAQLSAARGQYQATRAHLDSFIIIGEPQTNGQYPGSVSAIATELRAYCAALPFIDLEASHIDSMCHALMAWDAESVPDFPLGPSSRNNGRHDLVRLYLLGLLEAKRANYDRSLQYARKLEDLAAVRPDGVAALDQATGIRARVAFIQGDAEEALALLDEVPRQYELWRSLSIYFSTEAERFLRGEILYSMGEYEEALMWFRSMRESIQLLSNAIRFYHQARCLEALGDHELAIEDYRTFVELWRDCDPEQRHWTEDAKQRLATLSQQGGLPSVH